MDEKPTWRTMDKVSWSQEFSLGPSPRGGPDTNSRKPWFSFSFSNRTYFRVDSMTYNTPPSSYLQLVEFETCYVKPNPPLLFHQQSMWWSYNMVHSHFTLSLRVHDYIKRLFPTPMGWESRVLTITRSPILARVGSGPYYLLTYFEPQAPNFLGQQFKPGLAS